MSDFDLERLGDVWRQQPGPAEMEQLQRTAAGVSRRARFAQIFDVGAGIVVSGVVILLVLSNTRIETVAMGAAAILVLLISNIRQRRLRQVELRSLTGTTEDMLNQSIDRVEATLKHTRFTLTAAGPCLLIGGLVAASAGVWRGGSILPALNDIFLLRMVWLGVTIAAFVGFVVHSALAIKRGRRELGRLVAMREAYRHERESTAP